ncbi:MAG: NADH-quinone oxidoreductase subunit C [Candidatus Omnitrophota bacterium]|nr:NADH-quinone oxidoreductase subunit C [Candidatus Omnitrophota bacterium]
MDNRDYIKNILDSEKIGLVDISQPHKDELYVAVGSADFLKACNLLHKHLDSPVMMFFAEDLRRLSGKFILYCAFLSVNKHLWVFVKQEIPQGKTIFDSIAKNIYSASLFEREIKEMFGIEPVGNPDPRRLKLHDEVWPEGNYPLRKDFILRRDAAQKTAQYQFKRVEGEGVFEVPVGPVHAGIIGPGHFRFSVAGEPIINLETRLGWTHRGAEKILEGKSISEAVNIIECISGDTAFGYSLAFCQSAEKILGLNIPDRSQLLRVLYLELERIYNHANDIGGIALDVSFSFPAQFASLIKEAILQLNDSLTGSRYLKGVNVVGGIDKDIDKAKSGLICETLVKIQKDFLALEEMLFSSVSFMDRVDTTGILRTKTARDLGITGPAARASGIAHDLRGIFPGIYNDLSFKISKELSGDVKARLKIRFSEIEESINLIRLCLKKLEGCASQAKVAAQAKEGMALGYVEAWRGGVLIWTRLNGEGKIERCKIVDPSFHNWEGLSFAVLGNIIPDFPLCNKSFDLSYSGNDL